MGLRRHHGPSSTFGLASSSKRERESLQDDSRSGRPPTAITKENVDAVSVMVKEDRRVPVQAVAEALRISASSVNSILKDQLGLSKLCAPWVPKALRADQKNYRAECADDFLNKFDTDPEVFPTRIVTGDETWTYQYDPENKNQSKQWMPIGGRGPVKFKVQRSSEKVMATIFWDAEGVILVDFLEKGKTITGSYYEKMLHKLHRALEEKRPGKLHS